MIENTIKPRKTPNLRYLKFLRFSKKKALLDIPMDVKRLRARGEDLMICTGEIIRIDIEEGPGSKEDYTCALCSISESLRTVAFTS